MKPCFWGCNVYPHYRVCLYFKGLSGQGFLNAAIEEKRVIMPGVQYFYHKVRAKAKIVQKLVLFLRSCWRGFSNLWNHVKFCQLAAREKELWINLRFITRTMSKRLFSSLVWNETLYEERFFKTWSLCWQYSSFFQYHPDNETWTAMPGSLLEGRFRHVTLIMDMATTSCP
jgi:hypothetical protein